VVALVLRSDSPKRRAKVDYFGAFILMAGITSILLYITEGPYLGWASMENLAFLSLGLGFMSFFFVFESKKKENPLIELGLLRIKNVLAANIIGINTGVTMFLLYFAIIYVAELPPPFGLGLDVVSTGLMLAPATILMVFAAVLVGKMVSRVGPKPVLLVSASTLIFGIFLFATNRSSLQSLTIDVIPMLVGVISLIIPIVNMVSVSVPQSSRTVGLGINTMLRNLGAAIGPVLATTVMATYTSPMAEVVDGKTVVLGEFPSSEAFSLISVLGVAFTVVILVVSLMMKNYTLRQTNANDLQDVEIKQ